MPSNPDQTSLCLIPMEKFNKKRFVINAESECIFAYIDELAKDDNITLIYLANRPKIDRKIKILGSKLDQSYAIRFIPNRITHRASLRAKKIKENQLESLLKNFEHVPVHQSHRIIKGNLQIDDFRWRSSNIASNLQQKIAIKNIVNGSAFPFPYCVFGPPGKFLIN